MEPGMIWVAGFGMAALFFLLAAVELFGGKSEPPTTAVDVRALRRDLGLCPKCGVRPDHEEQCLCDFEF